ncbi:DUF2946 family protein [Massilia niastensis]|uniref:DUF2946 family protein n=1 Tax=Massilia niastensis TaxID=544911 RepID=UPI0003693067|nr:DUF2946 family protein [Massilia niastensis]
MKRYFLIFLLALLPLQFSWAAAGAYCAHEEGAAARHVGHHVHKHEETGKTDREASHKVPAQADADCDYCHHASASAICAAAQAPATPQPSAHLRRETLRYISHIPDLVPRPDRQALA